MTKRQCTTFAQKVAIHEQLKERIEITGEGQCRYKDRNDEDRKVAEDLGVSVNSIRYVRLEMFGKLYSSARTIHATTPEMVTRFNLLVETLATELNLGGIRHPKFPTEGETHEQS